MDALRRSIEAEKPAAPRGQSGRLEEAGEGVRTADEQSAEDGAETGCRGAWQSAVKNLSNGD